MEYPSQTDPEIFSYEQYLAFEAQSDETRYEFYDGEIVALSGAYIRHARIVTNTSTRIFEKLREGDCDVFSEGVKLHIPQTRHYLYPDIVVTCNPLDLQSKSGIRNPLLIAEVLSPSSVKRDRVQKMDQYLRLPSLRYYMIISQEECKVEVYERKSDNSWLYTIYGQLKDSIFFDEWNLSLMLKDIYRKVTFGEERIGEEEEEYISPPY
ncbi:MAG: Uma2 family endonuclease [Bacteroidia bacterium]